MSKILRSSHFERAFVKLPESLIREVARREAIFRKNPFDPLLKTHKLKGEHRDLWSFSIAYRYRIVFRFLDDNMAYFIDVGDHSIYQ